MKIQLIDTNSKKPLSNFKIQLQVRGRDSGYLTSTTDLNGYIQIEDKYKGQQISPHMNGTQHQWVNVADGLKIYYANTAAPSQAKQQKPSKQPTTHK